MEKYSEQVLSETELQLIDGGDWWQVGHAFIGTIEVAGAFVGAVTGNPLIAIGLGVDAAGHFQSL